jgi:predicted RNA binding protein YcfA (HicA-like mRNA interferase family)
VTLPVHGHKDLPPGTQKTIMRQAGLTDEDL